MRPALPHEMEGGEGSGVAVFMTEDRADLEEHCVCLVDEAKASEKTFEFDHAFGPASTQVLVPDEPTLSRSYHGRDEVSRPVIQRVYSKPQ